MSPADVVRAYYEAYQIGDLVKTAEYVHPDCEIDEPDFLPYGRVPVTGAEGMFRLIGGMFFQVFEPDTHLTDIRYFELADAVITNAIWHMTSRHSGKTIACHYQEYFEVRDGRIGLMRPFYHSARDMAEAFAAAEAAGVDFRPEAMTWPPPANPPAVSSAATAARSCSSPGGEFFHGAGP